MEWWGDLVAALPEAVVEVANYLRRRDELWAALIGAWVGGSWTSRVAKRHMRHDRKLSLDLARWTTGISTIKEMLDPLETMSELLEHLSLRGSGGFPVTDKQHQARTALDIMDRLGRTHAPLLPEALSDRWFFATELPRQYRNACAVGASEGWTEQELATARQNVRSYMTHVNESLAAYVQTGNVRATCDPPVLRPDGAFDLWLPPEGPQVGTLWERTRRKLANWRGTT